MTESKIPQMPQLQGLVIPTSIGRLHPLLAIRDIKQAASNWRVWGMLGWQDIRQRYRRSTLGPFWLTLSMGIMVSSIGVVYAVLLHQELNAYLPFVALGFIQWGFIAGVMTEGCQTFMGEEAIIKQTRLPLSLHVFRILWRHVIIFAHNFVIYVIVMLVFQVWPTWQMLWAVPAMAVWLLNAFWIVLVLGLICARFRDIPQVITSIIQLAFLVTPIIWRADLLKDKAIFVDLNPLHHFIEILRMPILGTPPAAFSWYFVLGVTVIGWIGMFELFRRYRWRISYWL